MSNIFQKIACEVELISNTRVEGKVSAVSGILIEAEGIEKIVSIGSRCSIKSRFDAPIFAEVIGIRGQTTLLMPFQQTVGVGSGAKVEVLATDQSVYPHQDWLGRVINAFGEPIDWKGPLPKGTVAYHLHAKPIQAHMRKRIGPKINMGVRAINTFLSCCLGQRMGIFSGSGVGKSMMIAMMTKFASTDIKVIGLIGERGREVQEFIEDYLGPDGLAKAIVVVATSDESALTRKQAAYLTMTLCEYYRDIGLEVLCLMDSVTRFATAQREIGLAAGEPPTTKGYTPSVFSELPKLLERAGPGSIDTASITALFSVLVEGDDQNEPIADAVRGILDGHIILDRDIAARGIYPAIDVLRSISRTMPRCNNSYENALVTKARSLLSLYNDMADMIRIGVYKKGSDKALDEAIQYNDALNKFISQSYNKPETIDSSYKKLTEAINFKMPLKS